MINQIHHLKNQILKLTTTQLIYSKSKKKVQSNLNLPKKCKRSLAIERLVCIFSWRRCARSHTSPRPLQQSTAIPSSSSLIPLRYNSMASSLWPRKKYQNPLLAYECFYFLESYFFSALLLIYYNIRNT